MDPDLASDRYMEFDAVEDDAFLIQRIDSNEIIYCPPKRKYKVFIDCIYVFHLSLNCVCRGFNFTRAMRRDFDLGVGGVRVDGKTWS